MAIILLIVFFILFTLLFFFISFYEKLEKKRNVVASFKQLLEEQQFNPDINTDNWDLHKLRLEKFRRSQYKGLTFFKSSEDKIYYLSEKGIKVYC